MKLTEDDLYRSSTQFRHWSFTSQHLAAQRLKINIWAIERVKANVARQRAQRAQQAESDSLSSGVENGSGANTPSAVTSSDKEVNCLTVKEEGQLVDDFCERAIKLGSYCNYPIEVTATCIQFLRRFYLYNSPMTYHVQNILRTTMFMATKAEALHESAERFAESSGRNITSEQVLAPEYLVLQGLRYNLDVRHPFRGLKGGHMELLEIAHGKYNGPGLSSGGASALQSQILRLPRKQHAAGLKMTVPETEHRIQNAYSTTSHTLKNAALLTDAYFLYTPSQIWLSAHLLADEPLTLFYLSLKLPSSSPIHTKLLNTLRACATLLSSHRLYVPCGATTDATAEANHQASIKLLIGKLKLCRDPDKVDLVKLNQAHKRDAVTGEGEALEGGKAKKRKLRREEFEKEGDAFFGGELGNEVPKRGEGAEQ